LVQRKGRLSHGTHLGRGENWIAVSNLRKEFLPGEGGYSFRVEGGKVVPK